MKIEYPFSFVPTYWWKPLFFSLLLLVFGLMLIFTIIGIPLNTTNAPFGVVSLELAGSKEKTELILEGWGPNELSRVAFGLGLDFLFIPIYTFTIGFGCGLAMQSLKETKWPFYSFGPLLAWGIIAAGLFDVIENIALTLIILNGIVSTLPQLAAVFAWMKFVLIFLGIVYVFYGGVISLISRVQTG